MNELALFAGSGGGLLGTKLLGFRTVCAVEFEPFCIEVLNRRQDERHLEPFPIWDDVRSFDGRPWRGKVDIITAGFPCQPFSVAGKREGELDERNMWPDTCRIIREVRPKFCLLENVPGLLNSGYFDTILQDLCESGYDARWKVISAAEVGAPHKRDRLWLLCADTEQVGWRKRPGERVYPKQQAPERQNARDLRKEGADVVDPEGGQPGKPSERQDTGGRGEITWWDEDPADVSDSESIRWNNGFAENDWSATIQGPASGDKNSLPNPDTTGLQEAWPEQQSAGFTGNDRQTDVPNPETIHVQGFADGQGEGESGRGHTEQPDWPIKSGLGRVAHGVANRVDRLKALGNGQVPAVVEAAWKILIGLDKTLF